MSISNAKLCPLCGKRERRPVNIDYKTTITLDRRPIDVHVPNLPIEQCDSCGEQFFGNHAHQMIDDALRSSAGLLTTGQMQDARHVVGVGTQQELAELIGVAPETLSRWMKGHVVQSRLADTMLRLFFGVPEARSFLRSLRNEGRSKRPIAVADRIVPLKHHISWDNNVSEMCQDHKYRLTKGNILAA